MRGASILCCAVAYRMNSSGRSRRSLGSADKKESLQKRLESSKLKLTQRFCHKERFNQHECAVNEQPLPRPRPRSLSLDW
ncbi:hypothetical protein scyTo_0000806 [Scyliorhinus torazame]|uniref:Uncharacterized protein n=1 Tax=Scyliorhinus torazame TaxID=75743 RepID=A0A401P4H2_SCYTO|nr:hypothetical protein [Scyliorhinus torazame]